MSEPTKSGGPNPADDLERLRELILGEKGDQLDTVYRRVDDPDSRTGDVAEVLPGAMHRAISDPVTKPEIEQPIVETIRGAIKRDTESFAEALFPVLGPAIRRAVSDALKSLVQRINVALEHSFTIKGLRWRLEAARSGVPFGQIVLRETMLYAVQEVFLIQPHSGLVLASARRADTLVLDEDAFSAMLTAIQAFIQDSLGMPEGEKLRSAELGDRTLWVVNGPEAALACLVIGSPPHEVRVRLLDTLESIHAHWGDQLGLPPEQIRERPAMEHALQDSLSEEVAAGEGGKDAIRSRLLWAAAGLALLAFVAWGGWMEYQDRRQEQEIAQLFAAQPGYVLVSHGADDGVLHFSGLRDPLAAVPDIVLREAGIDATDLALSFRPYQSLEKEFVMRRLQASLGGEGAVALMLDNSTLQVSGALTPSQAAVLDSLPGSHPLIATVEYETVRLAPEEAEAEARRRLNAPDSVSITAAGDRLALGGVSTAAWFRSASANTDPVGGWPLDLAPLKSALAGRLETLQGNANARNLMFTRMTALAPAAYRQLDELAAEFDEMRELASLFDSTLSVRLEGFADGVGDSASNRELARDRAALVRSELAARGIDPAFMTVAAGTWQSGSEDPQRRRVTVRVSLESRQ